MGDERTGFQVFCQTLVGATLGGCKILIRERTRLINDASCCPSPAPPETVFTGENDWGEHGVEAGENG